MSPSGSTSRLPTKGRLSLPANIPLGSSRQAPLAARSGFPAMEVNSCLAPSTKRNLLNQLQIHELQPLSDHIAPVVPSSTTRLPPKIQKESSCCLHQQGIKACKQRLPDSRPTAAHRRD